MAVDVGEAQGRLTLDVSGFNQKLAEASNKLDSSVKGMESSANKSLSSMGANLAKVGTAMSIGVTTPLVAIGKKAWDIASEFEASMSKVGAITGATGNEFDALRGKAVQLGKDTVFSSTEVAAAMVEMGKAGWNSTQIISGMEGVLDAASASGEHLSTVSTIVADAITMFGMSAADSTRVADVMVEAANAGTISISDLGESLKYIGPSAAAAGFSFEDVNTALLAMSKSGIKASQAGTSLRSLFVNLVKPTDAMKKAMNELGIEITNQDGSFKSLDDIIGQLRSSMSGMTDEQKAYYSSILAGKTGLSGLMSLLNMSQEEYDELAASIDNCGGVADETAAIMQDNLKNDVEQLMGSLESLAITVMKNLEPALRQLVQWLEKVVDWFTGLDPGIQTAIVGFLALVAALGPFLIILGGVLSGAQQVNNALGVLSKAFQALTNIPSLLGGVSKAAGAAFSAITSPAAIVVAAIALIAGAFIYLWNTSEDFRNKITEIASGIVDAFNEFTSGISERLEEAGITFESITDTIIQVWDGFCQLLAPMFEGAFSQIATILETVFGVITGLLDVFIGLFEGDWDQFWTGLGEIVSAIWGGITGTLENIWNTILGLLDTFLGFFGTSIEDVFNGIVEFISGVWEGVTTTVSNVWNAILTTISTVLNTIWATITTVWNTIVTTIQTVLTTIWNFITTTWNNILLTIQTVLTTIWTFITTTWNNIVITIQTVMTMIWTTIQNIWNLIVTTIQTVLTNIWNFITTTWNNIVLTIQNVMNLIWTTIQNVWNTIWTTIQTVAQNIWNTIQTVWNNILTTIQNVMNTIWTTIQNIWNTIWTTIQNVAQNIWNTIQTTWNNILNTIQNVMNNIWNTIQNIWNNIVNTVRNCVNNALNAARNAFNNIKTAIQNAMNQAKTAVSNGVNNILNFFRNLPGQIKSALGNLGNLLFNAGKSILNGLLNGLKSAWKGVTSFVGGIGSWIASHKGPIQKDRKLLIPAGLAIMEGLGEGLVDGFSPVQDDVSDMAGEIADSFADGTKDIPVSFDLDTKNVKGLDEFNSMFSQLNGVRKYATQLSKDYSYNGNMTVSNQFNYDLLASKMVEVLKAAPIQNNVDVTMEGGGVYLNTEQVGRQVAPVVSRVQAKGAKK